MQQLALFVVSGEWRVASGEWWVVSGEWFFEIQRYSDPLDPSIALCLFYLSYLASWGDRVEKTTLPKFNDLLGVELARAENFVKNKSITSIQRKHEFLYNPPKA